MCGEDKYDRIKNLFSNFLQSFPSQSQNSNTRREYVDAFIERIKSFEKSGIDAKKTLARLESALTKQDIDIVIRTSCELAAAFSFQRLFPIKFRYEVPSSQEPPVSGLSRDFDFAFNAAGRDFNVEVKCFSRDSAQDREPCKVFNKSYRQLVDQAGGNYSPNRMQALRKFLADANGQLVRPDNGLSVVLLCCKDWDVMADALECLLGRDGVLTAVHSAIPGETLSLMNIDAIVLCDAGMYHEAAMRRRSYAATSGPDVSLDSGVQPWEYKEWLAFGFFVDAGKISDALQAEFPRIFNLRTTLLHKHLLENGNDLQQAMFDVCNMLM